eukprot:CAMPEP_0172531176 /NCGR_PEP_ID=MMETSP1067-20121228/4678_1 /TAXON_ID=265564 ORGANISM="Thalassiosira punctigera, Strain Tpunct2005C2" /NCGR_SAMPLE_ID=MMETSP1067 /ASSEMBLY_ACC=CAM_ASM_000444 /LENGTH=690 /DNA_ID=CAMNT_0013315525 /DNA_START=49 /DNA_END=2121 /DNA_ORIENTATION=+
MLEDDPVIISEKDFTPTPSPSPVPSASEVEGAAEKMSEEATAVPMSVSAAAAETSTTADATDETEKLNASAVVSDDDDDNDDDDDDEGAEIVAPEGGPAAVAAAPEIVPTAEDVTTVEELALSISETASPPPAVPSARQIVSIGTESDSFAFTFHEEELNAILSKVPAGWKVCVVSVVGAFRTGKSFLLSWFLRYLESHCVQRGAESKSDGDDEKRWFERVQTLNQHEGSFDWRGGKERNTTGMWMWSDPYFLPRSAGDEVAILLVDTQGMFDHETTVGLTAAIFGLSTLLSSYQIYNVDKRIQEDNLQQLALFSEYGRMAFEAEEKAGTSEEGQKEEDEAKKDEGATKKKVSGKHPFQKIEFLVRDWQNFDTEDESDIASMEAEMAAYLEHVTAERAASDLKETRDQINSCFEEIGCFMMTHPGFAVIKNKYEGDVSRIEPLFMSLLDRYCQRVFDTTGTDGSVPRLGPKTVRGRELSAVELGTYIKSYAQMFEEIGAHFPKAETMLEATSKANNANAVNASVEAYSEIMNAVAGPQAKDYHKRDVLIMEHQEASKQALLAFDAVANFGNRKAIEESREKVMQKIAKDYEVFMSLNDGRNPLLGFETYLLPMFVAVISFVLRWIADFSCSSWSQTCRASSDILSHIYMVVFFFMVIVGSTKMKQITDLLDRGKAAYRMLTDSPAREKHE